MNINKDKVQKRTYYNPQIERIKLDNEISLILQSTDAPGDPEASYENEYFKNDPFKSNKV